MGSAASFYIKEMKHASAQMNTPELSKEVSRLEDILRCGYDSIAKAEIERNYAD